MSADEYHVCPKCVKEIKDKLENGYGKIPEREYNILTKKLENFGRYLGASSCIEIEGNNAIVRWYMECRKCGYTCRSKHIEKII